MPYLLKRLKGKECDKFVTGAENEKYMQRFVGTVAALAHGASKVPKVSKEFTLIIIDLNIGFIVEVR